MLVAAVAAGDGGGVSALQVNLIGNVLHSSTITALVRPIFSCSSHVSQNMSPDHCRHKRMPVEP